MTDIKLSYKQEQILMYAFRRVPLERLDQYQKYVFDCLRPLRTIENTDVAYYCASALNKFAPQNLKRTG
jgi:hypothetical protein